MSSLPDSTSHVGWATRHRRLLTAWLLVLLTVSAGAIAVLDRIAGPRAPRGGQFAALTAASTPEAYEDTVLKHADVSKTRKDTASTNADARPMTKVEAAESVSIWPLRTEMFIDSTLLEPAYGGLFILYLTALRGLSRRRGSIGWDWTLQLACLLVACGIAFDLAENGMTVRAAEDAITHLLAQGTVDDAHQATQFKWGFLGAAMLALALFGRPVAKAHRNGWLSVGIGCALAVAPFAALQCLRLQLGSSLAEASQAALGVLFFMALAAIGLGLRSLPGEAELRQ
jgi:hypothetical protein